MDFSLAKQGLKNLGGVVSRNSPHILTGLGCAGVLTTAIFTGRASIKAYKIVENEKAHWINEQISKTEVIKLTWPVFIAPFLMGATSIACIIGANSINASRNAALAALYSLSETAFREYKDKVVEEIGKNKETKIRNDVMQDRITNSPVGDRTVFVTGYGEVLCYDKLSDRYFKSSPEKIRQQVLAFSYDLMSDDWLDLNDLYYMMGLNSCELGNKSGFDVRHTTKGLIEVDYSSHLTPDGIPCFAFDATVYPNPKYMR